MTTAPDLHQRMADVILANAHDVADARLLFEMIGLVEPDGCELLPFDDRPVPILDMGQNPAKANPQSPMAMADYGRRPDNCTTPAGLRELPPLQVAKPAKPDGVKKAPRSTWSRELAACGTYGAYQRHKRHGEIVDDACAAAAKEHWRSQTAARRKPDRARKLSKYDSACGTMTGYRRHKRAGESACEACAAAARVEWKAKDDKAREDKGRGVTRRTVAACGTRSGYMRHLRLSEPTCQPCRAANAAPRGKPTQNAETARLIAAGVNPQSASLLGERAS